MSETLNAGSLPGTSLVGRVVLLGCEETLGEELAAHLQALLPENDVLRAADLRDVPRRGTTAVVLFQPPRQRLARTLADLRRRFPGTQLVALLDEPTVENLSQLLRAGVDDFVPLEGTGGLDEEVRRALGLAARFQGGGGVQNPGAATAFKALGLIGRSRAMRSMFSLIRKAADSNVTVLVAGESGTGKELVARAVHLLSPRQEAKFVPVNCGAIPRPLLESELFGHVRGAFSGAIEDKAGLMEEAEDGTLFLDEICDLPLDMQVKINRVLQERHMRRIGETEEREINLRFVAASNKNFEEELRRGRFREDLYFRLNVFRIDVPPLRERSRDIVHLAEHFLQRYSEREGKVLEGISPAALKVLLAYNWPGNVRELENTIERAVLLARGTQLTPEDMPPEIPSLQASRAGALAPDYSLPYNDAMRRLYQHASQSYVEEVLARCDGNVTRAAAFARIPRESLHRLMRRYGIRAREIRQG